MNNTPIINQNIFPWYKKLLGVSIALIIIGALCRIQHWPLGFEIICGGFLLLQAGFLLRFFRHKEKGVQEYIEIITATLFVSYSIMKLFRLPYMVVIQMAFFASGTIYLINYVWTKWKNRAEEKFTFSRLIFIFAAFTIILGALFKIQHWPGATILLAVGLGFGLFYMLLQLLSRNE